MSFRDRYMFWGIIFVIGIGALIASYAYRTIADIEDNTAVIEERSQNIEAMQAKYQHKLLHPVPATSTQTP